MMKKIITKNKLMEIFKNLNIMLHSRKVILYISLISVSIIGFIISYSTMIRPFIINNKFEASLEQELNELKTKTDKYYQIRMILLKNNISDNIKKYRDNIDQFIDTATGLKTMFISGWNGFMEWFSSDKEKVERFLYEVWAETMFSDEDINMIVDYEIENAIYDIQIYVGKLINQSSASLFEENEKSLEEIEETLTEKLNEKKEFLDIKIEKLKMMASLPLVNFIASEIASVLATKLIVKGVSSTIAKAGSNAVKSSGKYTYGIGIVVGLLLDTSIDKWQKDTFKKEMEEKVDLLAKSISENIYDSIISEFQPPAG